MKAYKALIIGSGAAGFACAVRLHELGVTDIALITEGIFSGTSRNTGSDKQTYYKLSLSGDAPDSVGDLAKELYYNGGIDGELALTEAANSAKAFLFLTELGIPFPKNRFGEYVGYRTDHSDKSRATSCGPLTSKYMTDALQKKAEALGIKIIDNTRAAELLVKSNSVYGVMCINTVTGELCEYRCDNLVIATGGEAGLYGTSVFPKSQWGGMGLAARAGATLRNMNCWQYGIASVGFRWNLSGSYQQALPRYVSVDTHGKKQDILLKYLTPELAVQRTFLKGYEWPFDVKKLNGSSYIDLLVWYEREILKNKVYLDYTENPVALAEGFDKLDATTRTYLENCGALLSTPIERLCAINPKAYELYLSNGIDLKRDLLEINVAAQHQCGGVAVNEKYESSVDGLYAIGEAAGVFGSYRPGGTALNSTQVGALCAAQSIAGTKKPRIDCPNSGIAFLEQKLIDAAIGGINHMTIREEIQQALDTCCSHTRFEHKMRALLATVTNYRNEYFTLISHTGDRVEYLKTYDMLLCAVAVLSCALESASVQGSIGGALVLNSDKLDDLLLPSNRRITQNPDCIIETKDGHSSAREPHPLPERELWFEALLKSN